MLQCEIREITRTPLAELKQVMEVNVWANKLVMDWLHAWAGPIDQIIKISSGAAVLGNKGWGGYALSKATLNMLARLYAHEFPATHITALAPGIIDTLMMDYLVLGQKLSNIIENKMLHYRKGAEEPTGSDCRFPGVIL